MHTRKIPRELWRPTLDELSRAYDGAIVSLEVMGDTIGAENEAVNVPLHGITADRSGVTIRVSRPAGIYLAHTVAHPKDVRIIETDEGAVMGVEIAEGEGTHTLLYFRSPVRPELLDRAVE